MTIKEVSEKFDITADTLRYYERVGLIPPVARNARIIRKRMSIGLNTLYV